MGKNHRPRPQEENYAKTYMPAVFKRFRKAAGLSQQKLADGADMVKSYIAAIELGYRAPNLNVLVKCARILGVRPGEIVDAMVEAADKDTGRDIKP